MLSNGVEGSAIVDLNWMRCAGRDHGDGSHSHSGGDDSGSDGDGRHSVKEDHTEEVSKDEVRSGFPRRYPLVCAIRPFAASGF